MIGNSHQHDSVELDDDGFARELRDDPRNYDAMNNSLTVGSVLLEGGEKRAGEQSRRSEPTVDIHPHELPEGHNY